MNRLHTVILNCRLTIKLELPSSIGIHWTYFIKCCRNGTSSATVFFCFPLKWVMLCLWNLCFPFSWISLNFYTTEFKVYRESIAWTPEQSQKVGSVGAEDLLRYRAVVEREGWSAQRKPCSRVAKTMNPAVRLIPALTSFVTFGKLLICSLF